MAPGDMPGHSFKPSLLKKEEASWLGGTTAIAVMEALCTYCSYF